MKKIYILIFLLLFFPITINASYGIENYKIDITVLENGDLSINEAFSMNGVYNGFERIIYYKGNYNGYTGSVISSTDNSKLYDGSGIKLNEIRGIDFDINTSFIDYKESGDLFKKVYQAKKGDYGIYTINRTNNGETYKVYNSSKMNKDFYFDYTLENIAITHSDVSEIALNLFTEMQESIKHLEVYIHIPHNENTLRIWAHGPLYGESSIIDNKTIKLVVDELDAYESIDFRVVCDRNINFGKSTNEVVLDKIIKIEQTLADEANKKRDEDYNILKNIAYNAVVEVEKTKNRSDYNYALQSVKSLKEDDELKTELLVRLMNIESKVIKKEIIIKVSLTSIMYIWILGLFILLYQIYKKYDKEYELTFKQKYFRDFPSDTPPSSVGYLIRRKVNNNDLSASILYLIYNKKISFEKKGKNDYLFTLIDETNLDSSSQRLIKLLFDKKKIMTLSYFKKRAKKSYSTFLNDYSNWINKATYEAECLEYFEDITKPKVIGIIYSIVGIIMGFLLIGYDTYFSSSILFIIGIISLIYFSLIYKRTIKGNEEYAKWLALKRFMENFSNMKNKDLPDITLWDKYLVYAVTLGVADKLSKAMKIKAKNLNLDNDLIFDIDSFNSIMLMNNIINKSVNQAISSAYSARNMANTTYSSGGGFGGGFSSGGGGFSGGGGGGRF